MKIILTVIFMLTTVSCFAGSCGESPLISTANADGKKVGIFAKSGDFEESLKWDINHGEPPLSISKAVGIVQAWSKNYYSKFDTVLVHSFNMQEFTCWGRTGHWLYVFQLIPVIDGNRLFSSSYMAAVTMSGKVLEPQAISE
ncbi:hypothetical protein [uncultured Microbulbifer sp.]|uniref:hypothetical protein n=1 Tax=uncultured Microbulbifer sp. TaxID=348147 RepID=UPI0026277963|nr:hypothetical protein [uncultured Microbulbifer sp.]